MKKNYFITSFTIFNFALLTLNAAQSPAWEWAKNGAGQNEDKSYSVAVDASGNSYITGFFSSATLAFGSVTITNPNNGSGVYSDLFIAKYDPSGNVLWAKSAGGTRNDVSNSIAVDASGNIYITGYSYSPVITFGSVTLTPNNGIQSEMFIAKYDPSGNVLWAKSAGGVKGDYGNSVSVDVAGNAYAVGNFESDSIIFGSTTLINTGGSSSTSDGFIVKYDPLGNVLWTTLAGGVNEDFPISISTDGTGNSYVAGVFSASITIGSTTLISSGLDDLFLAKYDPAGNVIWTTHSGGYYNDRANSVAFDASGNSYVAGYFDSPTLVFGSYTLTNNSQYSSDLLVEKYDPSGNPLWAKSAGGTRDDFANAIAVDASGNSFVAGNFNDSSLSMGSLILNNHDQGGLTADLFIIKFNTLGNELWAKNENADDATSIAVDAVGNAYVTGYFDTLVVTFGADTFFNINTTGKVADVYVAKIGKEVEGINSLENPNNNISLFPNPFSGVFHLQINNGNFPKSEIEIYDVLGNIIFQSEILNSETEINLSEKAKGIYFYCVINNNNIIGSGKIITQ
jgi:hypothetical protein